MLAIAPVWMTDGSPATVADLRQLETTHPIFVGMTGHHKGAVDPTPLERTGVLRLAVSGAAIGSRTPLERLWNALKAG
jgi:hypothetical protein